MVPSSRLAAWWSAWRWIAILALLLALSVWANLLQWRAAATAPLRDENAQLSRANAQLDRAIEDAARILGDNAASAQRLQGAAAAASAQLAAAGQDYRRAASERPITDPQCAPGPGRVDAVNRALGAPGESP